MAITFVNCGFFIILPHLLHPHSQDGSYFSQLVDALLKIAKGNSLPFNSGSKPLPQIATKTELISFFF